MKETKQTQNHNGELKQTYDKQSETKMQDIGYCVGLYYQPYLVLQTNGRTFSY